MIPRPTSDQLSTLVTTLGRQRTAQMLGVTRTTIDRWCEEIEGGVPPGSSVAAAACAAVQAHYATLLERVPEIVDAMVRKVLQIVRADVLDPKSANEQLSTLLEYLFSGKMVPVPTAEANREATSGISHDELLGRVRAATAAAFQSQLSDGGGGLN